MAVINIELNDYVNAEEGSLLIYKNKKWQPISYKELNKGNNQKFQELEKLPVDFQNLAKTVKHFKVYAKSHFLVVFNYFKIKILSGEIDVIDEELLKLDESVLNNEISVEEALKKHEFLESTFKKVYLDEKDVLSFPEV